MKDLELLLKEYGLGWSVDKRILSFKSVEKIIEYNVRGIRGTEEQKKSKIEMISLAVLKEMFESTVESLFIRDKEQFFRKNGVTTKMVVLPYEMLEHVEISMSVGSKGLTFVARSRFNALSKALLQKENPKNEEFLNAVRKERTEENKIRLIFEPSLKERMERKEAIQFYQGAVKEISLGPAMKEFKMELYQLSTNQVKSYLKNFSENKSF